MEYGIFRDKVMKRHDIGAPVGVAVAMLLLAHGAPADDAVGVVRVDAGTNGVVQAVMPFAPMDDVGPAGYVSGAFLGDGGPLSDRLFRQDALTGATTDAVWSAGVWLDPFVGLPSFMQASGGLVLSLAVPWDGRPEALSVEVPNEDASVVAGAALLSFSAHYTLDGVYWVSHRMDSGTTVVENRISAFDLPQSVELRMTGNSGIVFEDGAGVMSVGQGDFDETGDCVYRFFVPNGVSNPCQFLRAYVDGKEFAR